jgi:hypothetical protein
MDLLAYGCLDDLPALASTRHGGDSTDDELKERITMMAHHKTAARRPDCDYMRRVQAADGAECITPAFRTRLVEFMLAVRTTAILPDLIMCLILLPPRGRSNSRTRRRQQASIFWTAAFPSSAAHDLRAS